MSAGVLLVTAKLTRHNKAGAYQTLTVQFKLVPSWTPSCLWTSC